MSKELTITSERVDDTPLLMAQQQRMGIPELLDESFEVHGNWQGLGFGKVTAGWLAHILSEADHRMSHVQIWAKRRLETLRACTGEQVQELDFTDDRLSIVLRTLSDDAQWDRFERQLNQNLLRVYSLDTDCVRINTTTCSGYWEVNADDLFQFGYSKDHRPDLPQVKVVLSTLDPLGMPVATDVVAGNRADDPLYVPAIQRVRTGFDRAGLLYVGDVKMGALGTRAFVADGHDYYLCPLSRVQLSAEELADYLTPVWEGEQELTDIHRETVSGERAHIAQGYERVGEVTGSWQEREVTWTERRLVVRSLKQVRAAKTRLRKRLQRAKTAVEALNARGRGHKRYESVAALRQAAQAVLVEHKVAGFLRLDFAVRTHERTIRGYRERPTRTVVDKDVRVQATIDEPAVAEHLRTKGWRVYVTNAPREELPLGQAILAYRNQCLVERGCGRLKGRPLSVNPMHLQRDDHATGLLRLLSIGLRILTLLEFVVRRRLAHAGTELAGLYAGNPKRSTPRPTAERLLEAFEHITLTVIRDPPRVIRHLPSLTPLQQRILNLLDFSPDIYTRLSTESAKLT